MRTTGSALAIRGLSKSFPAPDEHAHSRAHEVLRDVDLDVASGEFVCLLGASGCGKTTLIRIVSRLIEPDAGEVMVDGRADYRPGIDVCMVFQNHGLFPWFTARENLEYGLKLRGVPRAELRTTSDHYLEMMQLRDFADHYPHQLSGGMQQRIGLARAMSCKPRVLLMDEPFAAVDAQTREWLQRELLELWSGNELTIIFVTHSLDEAVYLADRVAVMGRNPGRIVHVEPVRIPRPRDRDSVEYVAVTKTLRGALAS
jgi:NitT/TauT family transport system ATP-binding protein